ncbi:MAG: dienelactone hydrolase family protein [Negativicutes bacterium]|nr:dienelactone hydrolase family protein [Negativicutes bacterium]
MNFTAELLRIPAGVATLEGALTLPADSAGLVLFAHGSGSSRHSPRNNYVAQVLNQKKMATLLMDLLTPDEERNYETRFDITLLTRRLLTATEWMQRYPLTRSLPTGYFGASTGAAAALQAAAAMGNSIQAVVSRGGRPDLAGTDLALVQAPVLLIVGGHDFGVIDLNQAALAQLKNVKELAVVPGATHLFPEPGTLENAARLAAEWFEKYLQR